MNKLILFFFLPVQLCLAQLPDTDLWLFAVKEEKGNLTLAKPLNITNRPGYDNQPAFSEDGRSIYYVSIREDRQADVYAYQIGSGKLLRITATSESEYSPTLSPGSRSLVCVTVLADSSQILSTIDLKEAKKQILARSPIGKRLTDIDSVGYFTFLNSDTLLYYKLTKPHTLRARSISTGTDERIADDPVRGFKAIDRSKFVYGIKDSSSVSFFIYDAVLQKAKLLCRYPSLSEDIIWHAKHGLLKSEKSAILRYDQQKKEWQGLFDLSPFGIKTITRFSFSPRDKYLVITENK